LWHKGATSGFVQKIKDIRIDDDQDAVWITVDIGQGASCHVGYRSCFYRSVPTKTKKNIKLKFKEKRKKFDPNIVYKGQPNPTKL
jgi:phosphoribosyl-AMP cyclohydrolase